MTYIVRKMDNSVLLATLEKLIAPPGAVGTNEANILSSGRIWVTFDNIPTSCGSDIREGCSLFSILMIVR